jgi:cell wall-associated NlpC family hydrolase
MRQSAVGIHLPRVAVDQFNATVPVSDPQRGDLVFFANTYEPGISHVGIYIGDGLQINAPTARSSASLRYSLATGVTITPELVGSTLDVLQE